MAGYFGYLLVLVFCLIGWSQWLYFRRKLDRAEGIRLLTATALKQLYDGQFVGGCNWRYDGPPCGESTAPDKLCAPCFGRRIIDGPDEVLARGESVKGAGFIQVWVH